MRKLGSFLEGTPSTTLRDLLAVAFRRLRLIIVSFLAVFLAVLLCAYLKPNLYEAQMKILVKRERMDPLVTSDEKSQPQTDRGITEQEFNSDLELLRSRDLLEKVVVSTRLYDQKTNWWGALKKSGHSGSHELSVDRDLRVAQTVLSLERGLRIEPLKNSNLIKVTYESPDPELAARVLNRLADLYLEKHLELHRPSGAFDFFQQEAERYRKGLALVEGRLADLGQNQGVIYLQIEKEITLRQFKEFEASLYQTQSDIAMAKERIRVLEEQAQSTPPRMTTQVRSSSKLEEQLQTTLNALELKRIELLGVFQPNYPPLQEVEKQITETRAAITASKNSPIVEETTDRNPTHEWLRSELAKAKSDLAALRARAAAMGQTLVVYREKARQLDSVELVRQDLNREIKLTEENYMVYYRKQEEARISDALDRQRIVNVAVAETATVPLVPSGPPRLLMMIIGFILAILVSAGLAFAWDFWDPTFFSPSEVEVFLNIPVAAAMPLRTK